MKCRRCGAVKPYGDGCGGVVGQMHDMETNRAADNAARILVDPSASFWLKSAIEALYKRDPLDAARDAETLATIMQARLSELQS